MPKNIIWGADGPFTDTDAGEIPAADLKPGEGHRIYERAAILRWSKAPTGYVELGVAKVETAMRGEVDKQYVTLNRHGLNTLIRDLRAARDQAFGRDE